VWPGRGSIHFWLVFNANVCNIAARSWREKIYANHYINDVVVLNWSSNKRKRPTSIPWLNLTKFIWSIIVHNKWNYNWKTTNHPPQTSTKMYCKLYRSTVCSKGKGNLYRSVGRGIKHRCETGYHMTGSPFAVCRHLGYWNIMFACTAVN
jgi:hypothetical protein